MYNDFEEGNVTIETYFDTQTGVLVESIQKHPLSEYEIQAKLKDTSVWVVTELPSPSPKETPLPSRTAAESPDPTDIIPTPNPSTSITPTPESKPGIFLPFETLYMIIAVIVVLVTLAVLAVAFKRKKK